ncbi:MAG TPA: metal-dependent transcriptional regulator [Dermatophilaceae bacterium]|nr:metal-dependent transcriptional regulator [Dermatophilaceae bacterium]
MTDLIDTTEMYLRTIFELEEEGVPVLRARIAERMAHSGPTVSQTVARMERDQLLRVRGDRSIELLEEGRRRAVRVMRKHRLAERLLLDVIGLEYEEVHVEACRWEHVISERVERKILALLSTYDTSPYGNPIPGLDELGIDRATTDRHLAVLTTLAAVGSRTVVLERIGEPLQADRAVLSRLRVAGLMSGVTVQVRQASSGRVMLRMGGTAVDEVTIDAGAAHHVFVRTLPDVAG